MWRYYFFKADIPVLVYGACVLEWMQHHLPQGYQTLCVEAPDSNWQSFE